MLNDYVLISDLFAVPKQELYAKLNALGDEAARFLKQHALEALSQFRNLIVLTHVPPFRDSCWHETKQVGMRYRCNTRLRNALYHWARTSVQHDSRSKQQDARLRTTGSSHGRALRGVADRLLVVLIAMLKAGEPYDPERRLPIGSGVTT